MACCWTVLDSWGKWWATYGPKKEHHIGCERLLVRFVGKCHFYWLSQFFSRNVCHWSQLMTSKEKVITLLGHNMRGRHLSCVRTLILFWTHVLYLKRFLFSIKFVFSSKNHKILDLNGLELSLGLWSFVRCLVCSESKVKSFELPNDESHNFRNFFYTKELMTASNK